MGLDAKDSLTGEQKRRLFEEAVGGATFGRFCAILDANVYGVINSVKNRWKLVDEETSLLREIAVLMDEHRKHKMLADLEKAKELAMKWRAKYGK